MGLASTPQLVFATYRVSLQARLRKKAWNSVVGLWASDRHYQYAERTMSEGDPFDDVPGERRVHSHGNGLVSVAWKVEQHTCKSYRPLHQYSLDYELVLLAELRRALAQAGVVPRQIREARVDSLLLFFLLRSPLFFPLSQMCCVSNACFCTLHGIVTLL